MLKKSFLLLSIVVFCSAFIIPEKIVKKADKEIAKFYELETFEKSAIDISEAANKATTSEFGDGNLFKISSNGKSLGYGYIGNAPSKTATFDYLVLFDTDFIITKSKVLVYREEYGGEIGSKRWLKQFIGASSASEELVYNMDIIPISGATISVKSMTRAVNDLLQSIAKLQKKSLL
ncbi:FMN-binding protein [Ulvibacter antarcticus]|uniref:FMN-binding protein n=1 Tax=Ulvibacter antarcticus TaxID=442714 RepID=A0A3L9YBN0_9FLAO|nr:FMN-binding protein [Ulvibacter antarcticus]RMA58041.1 FMN-binding protein [Ulvibacter antarcticus]